MWTVMGAGLLVVLAACGTKVPEAATVSLEPVTSMGTNPFSPSVGAGHAVTPVPKAGGLPLSYPLNPVDRRGIAPRFPPCDGSVFLLDEQPQRGPAETRTRSSTLTRAACAPNTSRPSSCGGRI